MAPRASVIVFFAGACVSAIAAFVNMIETKLAASPTRVVASASVVLAIALLLVVASLICLVTDTVGRMHSPTTIAEGDEEEEGVYPNTLEQVVVVEEPPSDDFQ